ncbi:MAG TPA: tetratricopeptide repeat protein, partial [Thermoguttaceae bacterium]|nr:tetratricopeptide repeat protein [Thermoguttaceae bacterium]
EAEAAWQEVLMNMAVAREKPSELEKTAENFTGSEPGQWAALLAAEAYLANGCDALFQNKAEAREYLNRSRELFQRVLDESRNEMLRERATFGLARADEAAGDLEKAIESWSSPSAKSGQADRGYQGVLNLWPKGAYAEAAKARLEDLKRYSTKKFYDDFVRWTPRPLPPEPGDSVLKAKTGPELTIPEGPVFTPGELPNAKTSEKTPPAQEQGTESKTVPSPPPPSSPPEPLQKQPAAPDQKTSPPQ